MAVPDDEHSTHHAIAEQSYESNPATDVNGYRLVHSSPTMKIYRNGDRMIVGVRGTYDARDVAADAALAAGKLRATRRYKDDREALAEVLDRYGGRVTTSGHSLGGAIAHELGREFPNKIAGGVAYNSAYDAKTLLNRGGDRTTRYYAKGDPLAVIGGKRLKGVRWVESGKSGTAAHRLDNFRPTGGRAALP